MDFNKFRNEITTMAKDLTPEDRMTINDVFNKTITLVQNLRAVRVDTGSMEDLSNIPTLITNKNEAYIPSTEDLLTFVRDCKVPQDLAAETTMEVARILSGDCASANYFYDVGRDRIATASTVTMSNLYHIADISATALDGKQALESFGQFSDRVTSDSRLAISLTVLRAHRSVIDRVLARSPSEDIVVLIKISAPEVYNLPATYNTNASVRYSPENKQPLVATYRDPSMVDTTPVQIIPQKTNDTGTPSVLYANGIINPGIRCNLFDMTYLQNTYGYDGVNWTDLVSDGGSVQNILLQVTDGTSTEVYTLTTQFFRTANFVTQTNAQDSGDRAANLRFTQNFTNGALMSNGQPSAIFTATFANVNVGLDINFNANLNIKTSWCDGNGSITPSISTTLTTGVPATATTEYDKLQFSILGWTPYVFFNEENIRKTNTGVRLNYKQQEFMIPVGKNFIVDYSLSGQDLNEDVMGVTSNMIGIGNTSRGLNIIKNTLTNVNARLTYEAAQPNYDWYDSVAQSYAAGTLVLPYTYVGELDVSKASVMRESERLSDLHSYITSRLTGLIADAHNKSMYLQNFEPGERARWKVITSGPIAEVLFGIKQYWATLDDNMATAEGADFSMKLPNGTELDIIKTNFLSFSDTMILIPVRTAKPDDVTSFGRILDRGTFIGQYNPVSNAAAWKRIVANSREIVFPTNPMGMIITVQGLQEQLQILIDTPTMVG